MNRSRSPRGGPSAVAIAAEALAIAWDTIRANRLRSTLTILGVSVGVSVVVAIAALITGLRTSVMEAFEAVGHNNFVVARFDFTAARRGQGPDGRPPWWDKPEIQPSEAEAISALATVDEALYNVGFVADLEFEGQRLQGVQAQGYSSGWPRYQPGEFVAGRDFTPAEVRQELPVVVLSEALARELFGARDPIGRRIRVLNRTRGTREAFAVIGVFEPRQNVFTSAMKNWAVFPWTAAETRLGLSRERAQVLVVPQDSVRLDEAQDAVIAAMRQARGLGPREENDFALMASAQLLALFNRLTGVFFLVILLLASAGLVVGGVGVIGIMFISVTERTREIGIRKAVGATRREILWQFLVEASLLTALGGLAGIVAGWGLAAGVSGLTPLPARIPFWAVGAALGMAAITGLLFGLLPAIRASRMDPVTALRFE